MDDDLISRRAAMAACDFFIGPESFNEFLNGQVSAAQQIRGAVNALPAIVEVRPVFSQAVWTVPPAPTSLPGAVFIEDRPNRGDLDREAE